MAKPPKIPEEAKSPSAKSSKKSLILVALATSLFGAAAGFGVSHFAGSLQSDEVKSATEAELAKSQNGGAENTALGADTTEEAKKDEAGETHEPAKGDGEVKSESDATHETASNSESGNEESDSAHPATLALDPVITNIATPSDVWVRLEVVLKTSKPVAKEISDQIHQDFMAFFHTMRLEDLEGGSSFNSLKAELHARANTRADGAIDAIFFKTFLFE